MKKGKTARGIRGSSPKNHSQDYDIDIQSCSTTDCTGLIPSLPRSDEEVEHYNDLYHFLPDDETPSAK